MFLEGIERQQLQSQGFELARVGVEGKIRKWATLVLAIIGGALHNGDDLDREEADIIEAISHWPPGVHDAGLTTILRSSGERRYMCVPRGLVVTESRYHSVDLLRTGHHNPWCSPSISTSELLPSDFSTTPRAATPR